MEHSAVHPRCIADCNNGDCYGSRIATLADRNPDSNHLADLVIGWVARISAQAHGNLANHQTPQRPIVFRHD